MREPGCTPWRKKRSGILRHLGWQASWLYSVRIDQDAAGGLGLFSAVYHQIGRRWANHQGKSRTLLSTQADGAGRGGIPGQPSAVL